MERVSVFVALRFSSQWKTIIRIETDPVRRERVGRVAAQVFSVFVELTSAICLRSVTSAV